MKLNKKIFLCIALGISLFAKTDEEAERQAFSKLIKTFRMIEANYVDEITIEQLVDKSLEGLLSNLDAHSAFLNEKNFKSLQESTNGEFGGLGMTLSVKDNAITVIAPIEGTPADKAGIKAGDVILKIENESTIGMSLDDAVSKMRGKPNTKINITIYRKGEKKPLDFTITRDIIKVESVYAKNIENTNYLYLRITSFDRNVVGKVKEALTLNKNIKGIVIDLRNNPGGLLNQATDLLNLFIDNGVLVSQKGRDENAKIDTIAIKKAAINTTIPISIIVNGGSASASEIVSGAMQDRKRAIIVGEKTFGKGSVQMIREINAKEGVKLTIAKYYLPSGRTIQAVGVTPDIIVHPGKVTMEEEGFSIKESELKKHLENELEKIDGKKENKNDKNTMTQEQINNDAQLKSAIDALKILEIKGN
ncbi:carboxyl-terminal protease family protein [Campylobacter sp. RM5004]|uniref:S41 family peptidase n=1 Tax=Campylobacter sp. RM5004 TaxID=1660078 RepID=UPI001EFB8A6E|nr:S41 family peptidase [Campylobacter sp. RM5004]ULO01126.1 carboxyl-terminal protease family protein [Campylobacter sp. RM5004]